MLLLTRSEPYTEICKQGFLNYSELALITLLCSLARHSHGKKQCFIPKDDSGPYKVLTVVLIKWFGKKKDNDLGKAAIMTIEFMRLNI